MSLLVVGSIAFDSVETPHGKRDEVLGGSASFLGMAASYYGPVRMVGVVGEDFPEHYLTLFRSRHIDTTGVYQSPGKTFRWRGRYAGDLNTAHTLETQLNVLKTFRPELPSNYRDSRFVVLGNLTPEVQMEVLEQLHNPELVACDTMNYWIENSNQALRRTLQRVDVLSINDGEARLLSGEHNLVKAAQGVLRMGPKKLIIKRGEHGAYLFTQDGIFAAPGYPLEAVMDPTGAGDSFAGGMMGYLNRLQRHDDAALRQAVIMGSVLASFAVEDFSIGRFETLTQDGIQERFRRFKTLTHFEADI